MLADSDSWMSVGDPGFPYMHGYLKQRVEIMAQMADQLGGIQGMGGGREAGLHSTLPTAGLGAAKSTETASSDHM